MTEDLLFDQYQRYSLAASIVEALRPGGAKLRLATSRSSFPTTTSPTWTGKGRAKVPGSPASCSGTPP